MDNSTYFSVLGWIRIDQGSEHKDVRAARKLASPSSSGRRFIPLPDTITSDIRNGLEATLGTEVLDAYYEGLELRLPTRKKDAGARKHIVGVKQGDLSSRYDLEVLLLETIEALPEGYDFKDRVQITDALKAAPFAWLKSLATPPPGSAPIPTEYIPSGRGPGIMFTREIAMVGPAVALLHTLKLDGSDHYRFISVLSDDDIEMITISMTDDEMGVFNMFKSLLRPSVPIALKRAALAWCVYTEENSRNTWLGFSLPDRTRHLSGTGGEDLHSVACDTEYHSGKIVYTLFRHSEKGYPGSLEQTLTFPPGGPVFGDKAKALMAHVMSSFYPRVGLQSPLEECLLRAASASARIAITEFVVASGLPAVEASELTELQEKEKMIHSTIIMIDEAAVLPSRIKSAVSHLKANPKGIHESLTSMLEIFNKEIQDITRSLQAFRDKMLQEGDVLLSKDPERLRIFRESERKISGEDDLSGFGLRQLLQMAHTEVRVGRTLSGHGGWLHISTSEGEKLFVAPASEIRYVREEIKKMKESKTYLPIAGITTISALSVEPNPATVQTASSASPPDHVTGLNASGLPFPKPDDGAGTGEKTMSDDNPFLSPPTIPPRTTAVVSPSNEEQPILPIDDDDEVSGSDEEEEEGYGVSAEAGDPRLAGMANMHVPTTSYDAGISLDTIHESSTDVPGDTAREPAETPRTVSFVPGSSLFQGDGYATGASTFRPGEITSRLQDIPPFRPKPRGDALFSGYSTQTSPTEPSSPAPAAQVGMSDTRYSVPGGDILVGKIDLTKLDNTQQMITEYQACMSQPARVDTFWQKHLQGYSTIRRDGDEPAVPKYPLPHFDHMRRNFDTQGVRSLARAIRTIVTEAGFADDPRSLIPNFEHGTPMHKACWLHSMFMDEWLARVGATALATITSSPDMARDYYHAVVRESAYPYTQPVNVTLSETLYLSQTNRAIEEAMLSLGMDVPGPPQPAGPPPPYPRQPQVSAPAPRTPVQVTADPAPAPQQVPLRTVHHGPAPSRPRATLADYLQPQPQQAQPRVYDPPPQQPALPRQAGQQYIAGRQPQMANPRQVAGGRLTVQEANDEQINALLSTLAPQSGSRALKATYTPSRLVTNIMATNGMVLDKELLFLGADKAQLQNDDLYVSLQHLAGSLVALDATACKLDSIVFLQGQETWRALIGAFVISVVSSIYDALAGLVYVDANNVTNWARSSREVISLSLLLRSEVHVYQGLYQDSQGSPNPSVNPAILSQTINSLRVTLGKIALSKQKDMLKAVPEPDRLADPEFKEEDLEDPNLPPFPSMRELTDGLSGPGTDIRQGSVAANSILMAMRACNIGSLAISDYSANPGILRFLRWISGVVVGTARLAPPQALSPVPKNLFLVQLRMVKFMLYFYFDKGSAPTLDIYQKTSGPWTTYHDNIVKAYPANKDYATGKNAAVFISSLPRIEKIPGVQERCSQECTESEDGWVAAIGERISASNSVTNITFTVESLKNPGIMRLACNYPGELEALLKAHATLKATPSLSKQSVGKIKILQSNNFPHVAYIGVRAYTSQHSMPKYIINSNINGAFMGDNRDWMETSIAMAIRDGNTLPERLASLMGSSMGDMTDIMDLIMEGKSVPVGLIQSRITPSAERTKSCVVALKEEVNDRKERRKAHLLEKQKRLELEVQRSALNYGDVGMGTPNQDLFSGISQAQAPVDRGGV